MPQPTRETELNCPTCGRPVPDDAPTCPACGQDLAPLIKLRFGPAAHYNQALILAREGQLEPARDHLLSAVALDGSFVPAWTLLTKVEARLHRWEDARTHAKRATELAPDDVTVARLRQAVEQAQREAERAAEEVRVEHSQQRRAALSRYLQAQEHDVALAFGAGAGLAALASILLGALFGRKGRE